MRFVAPLTRALTAALFVAASATPACQPGKTNVTPATRSEHHGLKLALGMNKTGLAIGGGPREPVPPALDAIARARCAREQACGRIGPGRAFANPAACLQHDWSDRYEAARHGACMAGVDEQRLAACTSAITRDACTQLDDTAERLLQCEVGTICIHR